jgi:preprotein translocase subunit SecE
MAMNRQTKRLLQRQGQLAPDGTPAARRPPANAGGRRPPEPSRDRASLLHRVAQFLREVRGELTKVLWPKRAEVINYSTVVLTTLVLLALLIFGLNFVFAKGVLFLFKS